MSSDSGSWWATGLGANAKTLRSIRNVDEALRSLVRILAREAARELFATSGARHEGDDTPEGQR